MFAAMVFMAASFSLRRARLGGMTRVVLYSALVGFGIYFFSDVTQALGVSGILPIALAAAAPASVAIVLGMTLVFHHEDGCNAGMCSWQKRAASRCDVSWAAVYVRG